MQIALRDDDTNYWTQPEELKAVYEPLWEEGHVISLSVIPFAVGTYHRGNRQLFFQDVVERPLHENRPLVEFLKRKVGRGQVCIMLHGYSHLYGIRIPVAGHPILPATKENLAYWRAQNLPVERLGEYRWKDPLQLTEQTQVGRDYLERVLGAPVAVFVPPSNDLSSGGAQAVIANQLNISGTILLRRPNRPVSFRMVCNLARRLWWHARWGREVYPYPMVYSRHRELNAYTLSDGQGGLTLEEQYRRCVDLRAPFVVATHYWELKRFPVSQYVLKTILTRARAKAVALAELI